MTLEEFEADLITKNTSADIEEFCRKTLLHGTPFVFAGRENDYFDFKKRICERFEVHHTEIFIVGSGKLGFSPHKKTAFSLDSDIDVAIVSPTLWETFLELGLALEYEIRSSSVFLHKRQWVKYTEYLRYSAIGWIRPDLAPNVFPMKEFIQSWFDFFNSISYDHSEVGNYKVAAGIYRNQMYLERYNSHSFLKISKRIMKEAGR